MKSNFNLGVSDVIQRRLELSYLFTRTYVAFQAFTVVSGFTCQHNFPHRLIIKHFIRSKFKMQLRDLKFKGMQCEMNRWTFCSSGLR